MLIHHLKISFRNFKHSFPAVLLSTLLFPEPATPYVPPPERVLAKVPPIINANYVAEGKLKIMKIESGVEGELLIKMFLSPHQQSRLELKAPSHSTGVIIITSGRNLLVSDPESEISSTLGAEFPKLVLAILTPLFDGRIENRLEYLRDLGIETMQVGWDKVAREIVYRIGSSQAKFPKLLINKNNFLPCRFELKFSHHLTIDYLDYQLLEKNNFFPMSIHIQVDGRDWLKFVFNSVSLPSESFPSSLFSLGK